MTKQNEKVCNDFIDKVRKLLPLFTKSEKRFISDFRDSVYDFASEESEVSHNDLMQRFGEPSDIVNDYLKTIDSESLYKMISRKRSLIIFACTITILIVIFLSYESLSFYRLCKKAENQIVTQETITLKEVPYEGN
jgi:lipid II:glycine glycyltransferase (peptidoglycan interpeptide bridge formation enzyme)